MFKFNTNNIITGYIKQLLTSFNLPKLQAYNQMPPENMQVDGYRYISNGYIHKLHLNAQSGEWEVIPEQVFVYDHYNPNITKNLEIRNNIYDTYTHEYLGDYLRFQRDYNNLNLMPLYNCFSSHVCPKLYIDITKKTDEEELLTTFDTSDVNYKIYMLPAKINAEYTIGIDCNSNIEVCCGLYGKYQRAGGDLGGTQSKLAGLTYQKYRAPRFNTPVLYSKLTEILEGLSSTEKAELIAQESEFKLFIKVPFSNTSSITILEGNYVKSNLKPDVQKGFNHIIPVTIGEESDAPSILQLLKLNTQESYPFADRLLEYLLGNVVTHIDNIEDNIIRAQVVMEGTDPATGSESDYAHEHYGLWDDKMCTEIKSYAATHNFTSEQLQDNLGYIDKDVEQLYRKKVNNKVQTISNIDIYTEEE